MVFANLQTGRNWRRKKGAKARRKSVWRGSATLEDLKVSIGKGPQLDPNDIAHTYNDGEELLASLEEARNSSPSS